MSVGGCLCLSVSALLGSLCFALSLPLPLALALLWLHFSGSPTQCPPATAAIPRSPSGVPSICSPYLPPSLPTLRPLLCTTMSVHNTTREGNSNGSSYDSLPRLCPDSDSSSTLTLPLGWCLTPQCVRVPSSASCSSCCACIVLMLFVKLQGGAWRNKETHQRCEAMQPWSQGAVEPWSHCAVLQRVSFFANVCNAHTKRKGA